VRATTLRHEGELNTRIPIVFITGHGDVPTSVTAMKAGAVEFLLKPLVDVDVLEASGRARNGSSYRCLMLCRTKNEALRGTMAIVARRSAVPRRV
jgi:FixJ family two-component response regulator